MIKEYEIGRRIKARMEFLNVSPDYMALKMRITPRTWYRKISKPSHLTVGELVRIERVLSMKLLEDGK